VTDCWSILAVRDRDVVHTLVNRNGACAVGSFAGRTIETRGAGRFFLVRAHWARQTRLRPVNLVEGPGEARHCATQNSKHSVKANLREA